MQLSEMVMRTHANKNDVPSEEEDAYDVIADMKTVWSEELAQRRAEMTEMAVHTCEVEEAMTWPRFKMQLSEIVMHTLEECSNKLCEPTTWPGFEMQLSEMVMRTPENRLNKLSAEGGAVWSDELAQLHDRIAE